MCRGDSRIARMWWSGMWCVVLVACGAAEHRDPSIADAANDANNGDANPRDANTADAQSTDANTTDALTDATATSDASDDAVHCDHREVTCRAAEPVCPEMQVASVVGTCWGPCVRIDQCVCTGPQDCPHEETFACHLYRQRCGPYVN